MMSEMMSEMERLQAEYDSQPVAPSTLTDEERANLEAAGTALLAVIRNGGDRVHVLEAWRVVGCIVTPNGTRPRY